MKNKKLKFLASTLVIFAATASLTSCGGGVANAGEEFAMKTLNDLKEASSESNPIQVEFWHSFGHNISNNLDPLIESFEEEMKNQNIYIDVKATAIGGGYDGLRSRVNLGTKSNSIPTMLLGYPDHFADYIDSGILLPLDEYVNSSDTNIGLNGDYNWNDFIQSYREENKLEMNGKSIIAGIPFNKSTEVMYYNSTAVDPILKEKGYYDEATGKWLNPTWEEVWDVASALKTKVESSSGLVWTETKTVTKKVDYPVFIDSGANFFITTARQWAESEDAAKSVYTTKDNVGGKVTFKNSTTIAAQTYFKEKADAGLWNIPDKVSQSYGSSLMANGTAFISIGSTAGANNNNSDKYTLKCTTVPQKDKTTGVKAAIQQGTNCAILSKNSNNLTRLASWLLIRYLTSKDNTTTFSMNTGYLPVRESAKNSSVFQNFLNNTDDIFAGAAPKCLNAAYDELSYFYTDVAFSGSSIVRDTVDTMIQSIYCQNKDINAAMTDAYNELKDFNIRCE